MQRNSSNVVCQYWMSPVAKNLKSYETIEYIVVSQSFVGKYSCEFLSPQNSIYFLHSCGINDRRTSDI